VLLGLFCWCVASEGGQCAFNPRRACEQSRFVTLVWRAPFRYHHSDEKHYRQLTQRLDAPLIREVLAAFRRGGVCATAEETLALGRSRFFKLY